MKSEEWQILELAGAFHFNLNLVPRVWFQKVPDPDRFINSVDQYKRRVWWIGYEPKVPICESFDDFLVRDEGSRFDFGLLETVWVDENDHRVELWEFEPNLISEIAISIDVRYPYAAFLSRVLELVTQLECLIYLDRERDFVTPSPTVIYAALNRSPAARLIDRFSR